MYVYVYEQECFVCKFTWQLAMLRNQDQDCNKLIPTILENQKLANYGSKQ